METRIFQRKRPDFSKFKSYGFEKMPKGYHFEKDFMDGDFRAIIDIDGEGKVTGKVIDKMNEEEYAPLRNISQNGSYVSSVRSAYEEFLADIADNCYTDVLFLSDQANRIAKRIYEKYGDRPDFPWDEKPHQTSAVFRHPDTSKWYGLIMQVNENVFDKSLGEQQVNAMNLKINPEDGEQIRKEAGIYQGYHMNHKHWISVVLDDSVGDERVMKLVETSYNLTDKKEKDQK